MSDFKKGDIVRLRSGSPDMCVGQVWEHPNDGESVLLHYFHAPSGEIKYVNTSPFCLEKVRD